VIVTETKKNWKELFVKTNRPNYPRRCTLLFPILLLTIFAQTPDANIKTMIDRKEYFKAKDSLAVCAEMLPVEKSIYFGAILDNVFNRPNRTSEDETQQRYSHE